MEKLNTFDLQNKIENIDGNLMELNKLSAKHNKVEDWEFQAVGIFLVDLYRRNIISRTENWFITKKCAAQEFKAFLKATQNQGLYERLYQKLGKFNIGNLLDRSKLLINTKRGSINYRINYEVLFGMELIAIMDKQQLSNKEFKYNDDANNVVEANDIAESDDWQPLDYKGTHMEILQTNLSIGKCYCYVCQRNFDTLLEYRYHAQEHSDVKQYAWTKDLVKFDDSILIVHGQLHEAENKFCLKLQCLLPIANRLLLDKVYLVKSFNYFSMLKQPIKLIEKVIIIDIDASMLYKNKEQAFIFILRDLEENFKHVAEQHHYMLKIEKNCTIFKQKELLMNYVARAELCKLSKSKMDINVFKKYSAEFADYINNDKKFTMQNINGALRFLLEIEDVDYYMPEDIVQQNVQLQRKGQEYLFKITSEKYNYDYLLDSNIEICLRAENSKLTLIASSYYCFEHMQSTEQEIYVGPLKCVENGYMSITLAKKIPLDENYTVIERRSRFELRLQYRALERMKELSVFDMNRFLFPQFVAEQDLPNIRPNLHNTNMYNDVEQLQAVQNIIAGPHKDATYIIEGPSGSGKTSVIVESVLQLYKYKTDTKILVLATNESACDQLTLPIIQELNIMKKLEDLTRIYSHLHETKETSNDDKLQSLLLKVSKSIVACAVDILHKQRIVVCTLNVSAYLSLNNFGRDSNRSHIFTHIFVDNATAVTEPEIMMGLINMLSSQARLILVGDCRQTAPTVHSKRASVLGLNNSLMQRLLQHECYKLDNLFNPCSNAVHTRLRHNYRSHPEIVQLCDRLFKLKVISNCNIGDYKSFTKWHRLRNPFSPILFHHVSAKLNTGNLLALDLILNYVKEFMYFGVEGKEIRQADIGIIIHSHAERKFLYDEFVMRGWTELEINYADKFCGREKNIIICLLPLLGNQMLNKKQFYFIIMRARTLLLFVGDQNFARNNDCLMEFIGICRSRKILVDNEISDLNYSLDNASEQKVKREEITLKSKKQIHLARQMKNSKFSNTDFTKNADMMKEMVLDVQRSNQNEAKTQKEIVEIKTEHKTIEKSATPVRQKKTKKLSAEAILKEMLEKNEEKRNEMKSNVSPTNPINQNEEKETKSVTQQQQLPYQSKVQTTQQQFPTLINQHNKAQQLKSMQPPPKYHPPSRQLQQQFANNYQLQQSQYQTQYQTPAALLFQQQQQYQMRVQAMPPPIYHTVLPQQPAYHQVPPQQPGYHQLPLQQPGYNQGPPQKAAYAQATPQPYQQPTQPETVITKTPTPKRSSNNDQKNSCQIC